MITKIYEKNRALIVEMSGEIDHHALSMDRESIDKAFDRMNCKNIIFDFNNVNFMDSSGIGLIIGRYRVLELKGGKVASVNINGDFRRIFEISGLKKIIPCFDSIDAALDSFAKRSVQ